MASFHQCKIAVRRIGLIGCTKARGRLQEDEGLRNHGAERITDHSLLRPLPETALETFTFDGQPVVGRRGEPLAAALIAAGMRTFRTMPRFGDPRGGYCMVGRCNDCLVMVNGVPGVRACVTPVSAGLEVRSHHGLGEVARDVRGEPAE
jgi:hypothetical protein